MSAKSAASLAGADTPKRPARDWLAHSNLPKKKSSKLYPMKSDSTIDGVLLIDKAPGMTSHDVVAITRRVLNTRKVGHCGTLDPLATGLIIITIGEPIGQSGGTNTMKIVSVSAAPRSGSKALSNLSLDLRHS